MSDKTDFERLLQEAIARTNELVKAKRKPDEMDKEESHAAKEAAENLRAIREENEDRSSFRQLREKYATWVYKYLIGYSMVCFLLLIADGSKFRGFDLPDSVLEFLVGSTAVAAIGLVLAVTHGLFKR